MRLCNVRSLLQQVHGRGSLLQQVHGRGELLQQVHGRGELVGRFDCTCHACAAAGLSAWLLWLGQVDAVAHDCVCVAVIRTNNVCCPAGQASSGMHVWLESAGHDLDCGVCAV